MSSGRCLPALSDALGAPSCPLPINPPAPARHWSPDEPLPWRASRMMVKNRGSLVETAGVPRVCKVELLEIEMMAEFMAQRAQECAEGGDFFPDRRSHPHPDHHRLRSVVSEEFDRPLFPHLQRSGGKYPYTASRHFVELGCNSDEIGTGSADVGDLLVLHCRFDGSCDPGQAVVLRQGEGRYLVTLAKGHKVWIKRSGVGQHSIRTWGASDHLARTVIVGARLFRRRCSPVFLTASNRRNEIRVILLYIADHLPGHHHIGRKWAQLSGWPPKARNTLSDHRPLKIAETSSLCPFLQQLDPSDSQFPGRAGKERFVGAIPVFRRRLRNTVPATGPRSER